MVPTSVKLSNLTVDLGDFCMNKISLEVQPEDYYMILGPTGSGKTILLETIAGIHSPAQGEIVLNGTKVKNLPPEEREIGFVYQDYVLFPHLNVLDNVMYGLRARKIPDARSRAESVMDLLDLTHLKDRKPRTLSGGESQKVAVARAIAYEPNLLLLDEPTAALDPQTKESVRRELKGLHEELTITTLHVTHDQAEAKILGEEMAVLMSGEIKQTGAVTSVFNKPVNDTVADFVGVENILQGTIVNYTGEIAQIDTGDFKISAVTEQQHGAVKVYLRPEDIFISNEPQTTSARNTLPGTVLSVSHLGHVYRVRVDTGLSIFVTKQSIEQFELEPGRDIYTSFKATAPEVR